MSKQQFGIAAALTTPFREGRIDVDRMCRHAMDSLRRGCARLALFGTTGEGASVGLGERRAVLEGFKAAGVPEEKLILGVSASALEDALAHARLAADYGLPRLLVTPPFYFKGVDPQAVTDWFAAFVGGLPEGGPDVILYHIPQVTGVAVPVDAVATLKERFPGRIVGVKDSSGDWDNAEQLLARFPDLTILIGDERLLERAVRLGAAGSISGVANVRPDLLNRIMSGEPADQTLEPLVEAVIQYSPTSSIKALVAHLTGDDGWRAVRPPLTALSEVQAAGLAATFDRLRDRMVA